MYDGASGLETSHLTEQSQMSGIHPFMSAESFNFDDVAVSIQPFLLYLIYL